MIIINDRDGESRHEMRTYMRSRMRRGNGGYNYRTSTNYKDEESWKEGYEKGYKDACEDMKNGEL